MRVTEAAFSTHISTLNVDSSTMPEFIDITDQVAGCLRDSEVKNGMALVFSKHTTAAITIQENEPLLIQDMTSMIERLSPRSTHYRHNDFTIRTVHMEEDECPNGHSHCQHLTLGASETVPVLDGALALGQYQRIFMVELDDQKSHREVLVQIMGV